MTFRQIVHLTLIKTPIFYTLGNTSAENKGLECTILVVDSPLPSSWTGNSLDRTWFSHQLGAHS